ncbi:MAG TPA: hypothetical protein VFS00_24665, partial [Polyangiaceae bacterium]|nr:hypothetical protein [Polyangiaceae bacterium]
MKAPPADHDEPPARADEFEAEHVRDGSRVRHRDKHVARGMAAVLALPGLLSLGLAAFIAQANATSDKPVPEAVLPFLVAAIAALGVALLLMAIVFAVVRTWVTERAVHVKLGLWGPRVPLEKIRTCRVILYDWTEFGGWGLRFGRDGARAYVLAGGPVVELCYDDGGKVRRVVFGAANAAEVVRHIERARGAASSGLGERVRVVEQRRRAEGDFERQDESDAEADTEADA